MESREEIANQLIGDTYVGHINIKDELQESFIKGLEYSDQQNKQLLEEIEELKINNSNLEARVKSWDKMYKTLLQENIRLQSELKAADSVNENNLQ